MSIDPYAPCPCGSGKKLKFCCSDLAGEIQKIAKLVAGDQPHAALRHVEQLLKKQPERASLLDMRASLELSLEEFDQARETIQRYLALHPDNAAAYAQAAVMAAAKGETAAAVGALQAALERAQDKELPERIADALAAVGHALAVGGDLVAARRHLLLASAVAPEGDERTLEFLIRLNLQGRPPLLLRDDLHLAEAPAPAPWKARFDEATLLAERGLWQRVEADYVDLLEEVGPESAPQIVYNLALVRGWLGDTQRFAQGLRQYAQLDVAWDDAVEARAMADLVDPPPADDVVQTVRREYRLVDAEQAAEQLQADRRAGSLGQLLPDEDVEYGELGRPVDTFGILDRPAAATAEGLDIDDIPTIEGIAAVYGKRTDRDAVLSLVSELGAPLDRAESTVKEILDDLLGVELRTYTIREQPLPTAVLAWKWRLPRDTTPAQRKEWLERRRRRVVLEDWPRTPLPQLGGATAEEAAGQESLRLPLAAAVLNMITGAEDERQAALAAELRAKLQLPADVPIEPADVDLQRLPLVRFTRLHLSAAATEDLTELLHRAAAAGTYGSVARIGSELVDRIERGDGEAEVDVDDVFYQLVNTAPDAAHAIRWVRRARDVAEKRGQSTGDWAVLDLQLQLQEASPEGIHEALQYLDQHHKNDDRVKAQVYQILDEAGMFQRPEGMPPAAAAPEHASPAPPSSAIWTPDSGPPGEERKGRSAIWTP